MKEYDGAVLFVDILGISALTTSKKPLVTAHDFDALKFQNAGGNQLFCASLLSKFRKNLHACNAKGLKVAQLSDCAFLWSKNESLVVQAAEKLFFENTRTGILARAGMTYGQIIEPIKTRKSLGHFICGNAVTRAAQLEGSGKGARVFIDREIGGRHIDGVSAQAFDGMANPSDYKVIDEFIWFSCPKELSDYSEKSDRINKLVSLLVSFKSSPKLRWNAASLHGRIHLSATIKRLCKAATDLCEEIDVQPPHFVIQTSELFQELYNDHQYSDQQHEKDLFKLKKWKAQMPGNGVGHSATYTSTS